jgi:hypothetical protein
MVSVCVRVDVITALPDGHLPSALRNEPDAVFVEYNTIPFQESPKLLRAGQPKIHR